MESNKENIEKTIVSKITNHLFRDLYNLYTTEKKDLQNGKEINKN